MINTIQPFVNLINANVKAVSRFFQTPEITELTQSSMEKHNKVTQESFTAMAQSDALNHLSRELLQNFSHFTSEYMQGIFAMLTQSQTIFSHQVQDFSQQMEQGIDTGISTARHSTAYLDEEMEGSTQDESHMGKAKSQRMA